MQPTCRKSRSFCNSTNQILSHHCRICNFPLAQFPHRCKSARLFFYASIIYPAFTFYNARTTVPKKIRLAKYMWGSATKIMTHASRKLMGLIMKKPALVFSPFLLRAHPKLWMLERQNDSSRPKSAKRTEPTRSTSRQSKHRA